MPLPALPAEGENPWYFKRNAFDEAVRAEIDGRLSDVQLREDFAAKDAQNVFTEPQVFDAEGDAFHIGDKLRLHYVDGFFGQRLQLTGLPQAAGQPDVMPYFEVVPTTQTGTDVGGAVAGVQVYRTQGGGGVPNREFLAIEASGDLGTVPGFKIAPWASGTGQLRPIVFWDGTHEVFRIQNDGTTGALRIGNTSRITSEDTSAAARIPILFRHQGTVGDHRRVYSSNSATRAYVFFSKNRGTIEAPTPPGSSDLLGDVTFGSTNSGAEVIGAYVRATSKQTWVYGSAQGTKLGLATTPAGAAGLQVQAELDEPTAASETGLLLRVDRAGARTLSRVSVGAPDSGGPGLRALTVPN